jgi:DNA polymerase I-like protein with 3'-5' exonuclease and polymerase domains/uracil-DNA glycosylase
VDCSDCTCFVKPDTLPVPATCRAEGLIAVVFDAPTGAEPRRTVLDGVAGEIFAATLKSVARYADPGRSHADILDEIGIFYAVARPVPGGKAPKVATIRNCNARLMAELEAARPRMVLSVGAAACQALAFANVSLRDYRGQMRWLDLPSGGRVPWVATLSPGAVARSTDLYRDLSYDVLKTWTQKEPLPAPDVTIYVPRTSDDLRASVAVLDGFSEVSCDVETTGVRPHRDKLLSVGFGAYYGDNKYVSVIAPYELLDDPEAREICWDTVFRKTRRTIFQNGKFDLAFLARWFGEPTPPDALLGDTLLLGHLLDERPNRDNSRVRGLGLKEQAAVRYDQEDYHWDWGAFYATPEAERDWDGLYGYQSLDVAYTARWWKDLVEEAMAESPRLLDVHDSVVMPGARTLSACELAGAPVDRDWLLEFSHWLRRRIARRESALLRASYDLGFPPDVGIGSPAQIADVMYDVWKMTPDVRRKHKDKDSVTPDRSTDKEHIEAAIVKYVTCNDEALVRAARWLRSLLRWRADKKNLSTYSETLLERVDEDGRIRASFLLHGTATGRLSSREPNLQNIPAVDRHGATPYPPRRAFAPPPGYLWVEADYSQLELRVAAWLSGDPDFIRVFAEGKDIHTEVASTMFSKPPEQISKPERFLAKAVDFGILYGRTGEAISKGAEMDYLERKLGGRRWDVPTANAFIAKFMRGYPRLAEWLEENAADAVKNGYVESPFGRRRRFPFKPRTKYEVWAIGRQANNTPIQSAASDLCLMAMARIALRLPEGATVLFPVHDSICLEVRADLMPEVEKILREEMEQTVGGVPLTVDVECGPSWADLHDVRSHA